MMTGGKPKPTAIRRLQGNPGKKPYNPDEPSFATVSAANDAPPAVLADDAIAAAEWIRLAPLLRLARVLTDADRNALVAYCQQWSIYQQALTLAPTDRRVLKSPNGYPVINPHLSIANKALMFCDRLGEQLGLTPGGRARISTAAARDDDPFAEFDAPRLPALAPGPDGRPRVQ